MGCLGYKIYLKRGVKKIMWNYTTKDKGGIVWKVKEVLIILRKTLKI